MSDSTQIYFFVILSAKYCFYCLDDTTTSIEVEKEEEFERDVDEDDELGTYEDQKRNAECFM